MQLKNFAKRETPSVGVVMVVVGWSLFGGGVVVVWLWCRSWGGLVYWWCGEVWAGTMVGFVVSQEGAGHALPSSNMLDDLAFGGGVGVLYSFLEPMRKHAIPSD